MPTKHCDAAVPQRILVVGDSPESTLGLRGILEHEGYDVAIAEDGISALELIDRTRPAVVLLDLRLPVLDGFGVLRKLRSAGNAVPVIAVSANGEELARVTALRCGADDIVVKPFSLMELMERVKIQCRRSQASDTSIVATPIQEFWIGPTRIDIDARVATRDTLEMKLRPKEFDLLMSLWNSVGTIVSKEQLLKLVWGFKCEVETRTLDFHVATLREKLEVRPSQPEHLLTVRGVGYRLIA